MVREQLRGMSQVELAKAMGLSSTSITHFERGTRKPSFDNLRKLAAALNVSTDYLLGRVDTPHVAAPADSLNRYGNSSRRGISRSPKTFLRLLAEREFKERDDGE